MASQYMISRTWCVSYHLHIIVITMIVKIIHF